MNLENLLNRRPLKSLPVVRQYLRRQEAVRLETQRKAELESLAGEQTRIGEHFYTTLEKAARENTTSNTLNGKPVEHMDPISVIKLPNNGGDRYTVLVYMPDQSSFTYATPTQRGLPVLQIDVNMQRGEWDINVFFGPYGLEDTAPAQLKHVNGTHAATDYRGIASRLADYVRTYNPFRSSGSQALLRR